MVLSVSVRTGVCGTAALVVALTFVGASPATNCPAATAYAKKAATARASYFKTHKQAAQRAAFVKKQQTKLAELRAHCAATPAPAPTPGPTPTPAPTPTSAVNLTMGSDMPAAQGDAIKQGIQIAETYFAKLGVPAGWHANVYAEATLDAIAADALKATGSDSFTRAQCANACAFVLQGNTVLIFPFGSSYYRPDELTGHVKTPVHELWHTVQYMLAPHINDHGADGLFIDGPTWLREGSAEFVGYSALQDASVDASFLVNNWHYDTRVNYAGVSLASTASGQGNNAAYSLGFFAVQLLVKDAGSMHSLIDYWTRIGQGTAWPAAFQQTFGRTPEQFYSEFETYRTTL